MRSFMEHPPNRIVRLLQLGQYERVLAGRSIWYCASCETCSTRCPNKVDLASIMDALRKCSWDAQGASKESLVQLANRLFLENIRTYGRQYEMRLAAVQKMTTQFNIGSDEERKGYARHDAGVDELGRQQSPSPSSGRNRIHRRSGPARPAHRGAGAAPRSGSAGAVTRRRRARRW